MLVSGSCEHCRVRNCGREMCQCNPMSMKITRTCRSCPRMVASLGLHDLQDHARHRITLVYYASLVDDHAQGRAEHAECVGVCFATHDQQVSMSSPVYNIACSCTPMLLTIHSELDEGRRHASAAITKINGFSQDRQASLAFNARTMTARSLKADY